MIDNKERVEKKIAHLSFIQGVITRMGRNIFYLRGWVITLVVGILVLLFKTEVSVFLIIFLITVLIFFWCHDAYFLALEKKYRDLYDKIRKRKELEINFSMELDKDILDKKKNSIIRCMLSKTLVWFYIPLLLAIVCLYLIFFYYNSNYETRTTYYSAGIKRFIINYKNDLKHGLETYFWSNGEIVEKINYKDGKRHGIYKQYSFTEGNLTEKRNYKDGKLDGVSRTYDRDGNLKTEKNYKNGIEQK